MKRAELFVMATLLCIAIVGVVIQTKELNKSRQQLKATQAELRTTKADLAKAFITQGKFLVEHQKIQDEDLQKAAYDSRHAGANFARSLGKRALLLMDARDAYYADVTKHFQLPKKPKASTKPATTKKAPPKLAKPKP